MKNLKKILSIILVVFLAFSVIGCQSTTEVKKTTVTVEEPATVVETPVVETPVVEEPVVETPAVEEPAVEEVVSSLPYGVEPIVKSDNGNTVFDLFIAHTNDVHGRVGASDDKIGYSKLATLVKAGRAITDYTLLLDAGDTIHGTNDVNFTKGESAGILMSLVGYDAIAPGNHDFNFGTDRLKELAALSEEIGGPKVLAANVLNDEGYNLFQPYQIYTFDGFDVAVIGLCTPDTKVKSHPDNTKGVNFITPEIAANAQMVIDLAHQIADYVIVLGHIGIDPDSLYGLTSEVICENIDGIDLFVDGHSHSELKDGLRVNDTLIVQTGEYLENLGLVQIRVENGEAKWEVPMLIPASAVLDPANSDLVKSFGLDIVSVPNDPTVDAYLAQLDAQISSVLNEVVATVPFKFVGDRSQVRTKATNLTKFFVQAMTEESGADFTIVNGGGFRAGIDKGDVTVGDINDVLPFTNILTVCEITGADVIAALEHGYRLLPETNGGFPQSDLRVAYSKYAPAGSRVMRVSLPDGTTLDKDATYKVATNDFLAAGGDGYSMFGKKVGEGKQLNEILIDALAEAFPAK